MSSTVVPWPGHRGSSTANPAAAKAAARPRIDDGLPVKPWHTSTPCGPPGQDWASAPAMTAGSDIRILRAERLLPPVVDGGRPIGVFVDAVDRADRGQTLPAAGAQLGKDDDVDPVVEDRPE